MLSHADNEMLTRIGSGTPMGAVIRKYWIPALTSDEVPEKGGDPVRVRLLGESLIAFRDSSGEVGLVGEHCSHRGASLYFARNQDCSLQCVYHGWRFDKNGKCLETPNELPESTLKHRASIAAYPCVERNGVIWTYMGGGTELPALPDIEWNLVPANHVHISKRVQECNWAQTLEGGIDSSHGSFLHALNEASDYSGGHRRGWGYLLKDRHPRFEVEDTSYGVLLGVRRNAEDDSYYWRITQFLMPFYTMIPPYGPNPSIHGHAFVPMDDHTTLVWTVTWHPNRPLTKAESGDGGAYEKLGGGVHLTARDLLPKTNAPAGAWYPRANKSNDYMIDRSAQRTTRFSGVPGIAAQDAAVQESMGPIYDRANEHLGAADAGIARVRRRFLQAARELTEHGSKPVGVHDGSVYQVRSAAVVLPRDANWVAAASDWLNIKPGVHMDAA